MAPGHSSLTQLDHKLIRASEPWLAPEFLFFVWFQQKMRINQQTNEQRVTVLLLRMTCAFPPSTLSRVSQGSKGLKSPRKSKQKRGRYCVSQHRVGVRRGNSTWGFQNKADCPGRTWADSPVNSRVRNRSCKSTLEDQMVGSGLSSDSGSVFHRVESPLANSIAASLPSPHISLWFGT